MANKKQESESAYSDVSKQAEQAQKDAEKDVEYDDEGNPKPQSSEAADELAAEMSTRAAGSFEGGGPFPPEILQERYMGSTKLARERPEYTSHEE